ncbi:hypothetical protein P3S68_017686 [Capsicum galapagoense]
MLLQSQDEFKELARCYLCGKTLNMTLSVRLEANRGLPKSWPPRTRGNHL